MASILDDLKGILGDAAIAKLEADGALKARLTRGDELRGYYDGDDDPAPVRTNAQDDPAPVRRDVPNRDFDRSDIQKMIDKTITDLNAAFETKVAEAVQKRGDELYNNVRSGVRGDALQLVKIYTRHQQVTGQEWNDAEEVKFNDFLKANNEAVAKGAGKRYGTLTEAYNDYIQPVVTEREVDRRVDEKFKAESGKRVPGTTPAPSVNSNIMHFKKRSLAPDGQGLTGAQKAAALLDAKLAAEASA